MTKLTFPESDPNLPIDRGWAWVVLAASFSVQLLSIGAMKSFGLLYQEYLQRYQTGAGATAWILSLAICILFLLGSVSTALSNRFGVRWVIITGGLFVAIGHLSSAFITRIELLYLTYGAITGIGYGLTYVPTVLIVSIYFQKRRALATGIAVAGNGIGNLLWPLLIQELIKVYSVSGTLIIMSAILFNICTAGALMRPIEFYQRKSTYVTTAVKEEESGLLKENDVTGGSTLTEKSKQASQNINSNANETVDGGGHIEKPKKRTVFQTIIKAIPLDFSLLKSTVFIIYVISYSFATFAYPSNFVMIPSFAQEVGASKLQMTLAVSLFGLFDLCGRIFFGFLADLKRIRRKYVYAATMITAGIAGLAVTFSQSFIAVAIYASSFGLFGGSYWALAPVLLGDCLGITRMASAFGLSFTFISVASLLGSPTMGFFRDLTGSWRVSLRIMGSCMIAAPTVLLLERFAQKYDASQRERKKKRQEEAIALDTVC